MHDNVRSVKPYSMKNKGKCKKNKFLQYIKSSVI